MVIVHAVTIRRVIVIPPIIWLNHGGHTARTTLALYAALTQHIIACLSLSRRPSRPR